MKIQPTSIPVDDPIQAFKFYTEVLGFREKLYLPDSWVAIVASPEQPDGTALLLEPNHNPISKNFQKGVYKAGLPIIVMGVEDVQLEYEKLKSKGVVFKKPPTRTEWGIEAVFEDTCGNYIQIAKAE